jgi:nucleolar protein 53
VNGNEWLEASTKAHTLINLGNVNAVKKPPKDLKDKTSKLAAVEPPHPGSSYNPSLKDHNVRITISILRNSFFAIEWP